MTLSQMPHRWLPKLEWIDGEKQYTLRPLLQRLNDVLDRLQEISQSGKPYIGNQAASKEPAKIKIHVHSIDSPTEESDDVWDWDCPNFNDEEEAREAGYIDINNLSAELFR